MEAAVTALLELLDGSEISQERCSAALRRIQAKCDTAQSGTAAVSDRAVQRLLAHVHVRYNPAEDEPFVLLDRLLTANAAADCVLQLLLHPQYAATAALRTRDSVYALFDALVAVERQAVAAQKAGTVASYRLEKVLFYCITTAASISAYPPDEPHRAGWPPADSYCDSLLQPGVITALLNVQLRWAQPRQSVSIRGPISATRFGLQQLISNRRSEAGSVRLNLPVPTPTHDSNNPNTWASLIAFAVQLRLDQLPAAAEPAPLLSELSSWLNLVPELHSVFGDKLMQVFANNSALCPALMRHIRTPALPLELRQDAGAIIFLLRINGASDEMLSVDALCGWEAGPFVSGLLQLVSGRGRNSNSGSGQSQGGAGQPAALASVAQAAAEMAAQLLVVFAMHDLKDMQPSRIAAQPGAAASIVGGLRACLHQLAASTATTTTSSSSSNTSSNNSPSTPERILVGNLPTLANLCFAVGAVALARDEHGGSSWAAFMVRLAPLRDLITLITSGGSSTGEVTAAIQNNIACGMYAVAAKHAAVVLQRQQQQQQQQQQANAAPSRWMSRQRYSTTVWRQPCAC